MGYQVICENCGRMLPKSEISTTWGTRTCKDCALSDQADVKCFGMVIIGLIIIAVILFIIYYLSVNG